MAYTTTTNKLKITELDFDAIKTALKTYLQGQTEFADYNFEGSALNILLDVLAYNTHYNGFYTNMLASEMFMDSASLRSSVVSLAKQLGYTPASRKGSYVNVDITITNVSDNPGNIPINKATKFASKINNQTYTFLNPSVEIATKQSDGSYKASNVEIREGIYFTNSYTATGSENELFEIANKDVDTDTLSVFKGGEAYQRVDEITEITSTSKVYYLQEGRNGKYEIYFGDNVLGKKAESGETIDISYFVSLLGEEGNGATAFTAAQVIQNSGYTISVALSPGYTRSSGGSDSETVSSIRNQAPRQYALQKRVVTSDDYRARLVNDYNLVSSVRVWGGEENDPPEYGKVYIAIKPKTGYVLSDGEKNTIKNDILKKRNMVTITPTIIDPEYLNLVLDCRISYDSRKSAKSSSQLQTIVQDTISNYSDVYLERFDDYFRNSMLTHQIDSSDISITNSLINLKLKKSFTPRNRVLGTFEIRFDNPLYHPHEGHMSILSSTTFTYNELTKCSLTDKDGIVYISRIDPITEGKSDIVEIGTIDYDSGKVNIERLSIESIDDGSNYIYVNAVPRVNDVISKGKTILSIDPSDISIQMVDDTTTIASKAVQGY